MNHNASAFVNTLLEVPTAAHSRNSDVPGMLAHCPSDYRALIHGSTKKPKCSPALNLRQLLQRVPINEPAVPRLRAAVSTPGRLWMD
jgi:hypothetical protein